MITILLFIIGLTAGSFNILKYYATDEGLGLILYLMAFIYGAIEWFILAGLIMSVGIIIDVYANERGGLGKVIVFPFFVTAIGIILYGASIFLLTMSGVPDFPVAPDEAYTMLFQCTIAGIITAIIGVLVQFFINRKMLAQRKQEIIEVI